MSQKFKLAGLAVAVLFSAHFVDVRLACAQSFDPSVEMFIFDDPTVLDPAQEVPVEDVSSEVSDFSSSSLLTAPSFFDTSMPEERGTIIDPIMDGSGASVILSPKRPKKLKVSREYLDRQRQKSARDEGEFGFHVLSPAEILSHIEPDSSRAKPVKESQKIQVDAKPMRAKTQETVSVVYQGAEHKIDTRARASVTGEILKRAYARPSNKIRLYAYASDHNKTEAEAKRLSLQRALDIRDFLVAHDVDSKRIAIFPMGYAEHDARLPKRFDKVDVVFTDS